MPIFKRIRCNDILLIEFIFVNMINAERFLVNVCIAKKIYVSQSFCIRSQRKDVNCYDGHPLSPPFELNDYHTLIIMWVWVFIFFDLRLAFEPASL